jgi:hypothetical protein
VHTNRTPLIALSLTTAAALALAAGLLLGRRAADRGAALVVTTRPAGVAVEIDGRRLDDASPTMARGLAAGRHRIRLVGKNGVTVDRDVELAASDRDVIDVMMPPASRRVEVHSTPEGAQVIFDGRLLAMTPATVDVSDDDFHELRVEMAGYEPAKRALTPDDKEPSVNFALVEERAPRGTVFVDANEAAQVFIDGSDTGYVTPTLGLRLSAGAHEIEVRAGQRRATSRVELRKGETLRLLLNPVAK